MTQPSKSTVLATVVGGAIGDAMGAPFEGLWSESIPSADSLESDFHEYHGYPLGQYTDDTQLTLATIESIVGEREIVISDIARRIAELWRHQSVIGPGGACTQAAESYIATGDHSTMGAPEGQAGNGTAMRTAALGLWFGNDRDALVNDVADISRITHRDSRSVAGGVIVALAANVLAFLSDDPSPAWFCSMLADSCRHINLEMSELLTQLPDQFGNKTVVEFVAYAGQSAPEFDRPIISPFVIPTVLASIYCLLTNADSWIDAVTAAVRLGGDVDTLGAIVGALAGARHGFDALPTHLVETVQDSNAIQVLAARYHGVINSG